MADDGAATVAARRAPAFTRSTPDWVIRTRIALLAVGAVGVVLVSAGQTVLGRYVYYRAEDAAVGARKELRQTVDAIHNWWHHVQKTVVRRDKRRGTVQEPDRDAERWVGMIDVPRR